MKLSNVDLALHIGYLLDIYGRHNTAMVHELACVAREIMDEKQTELKLNRARRKLNNQILSIDEQVDRLLRFKEELKTISKNIVI